jgi:hypothetical protein
MRILLTFLVSDISLVLAKIVIKSSEIVIEAWDKYVCIVDFLRFGVDFYLLIHTHHQELMKSVGSHVSPPLLFLMKSDTL